MQVILRAIKNLQEGSSKRKDRMCNTKKTNREETYFATNKYPPHPLYYLFLDLGTVSDLAGGPNIYCRRGGAGTLCYNRGEEFF